jgi:dTDP-4-dehydrorhamnose reductase
LSKLLVFGANGQLAKAIAKRAHATGRTCECVGRDRVDLASPEEARLNVARLMAHQPKQTVVINTAAYTQVDKAESDAKTAFFLNAEAAGLVAAQCQLRAFPLIHISTDFVFSGPADSPFSEDAPKRPLGVYGQSKAAGENAVIDACASHLIIRTAWLVSEHPGNFLTTMLRLAKGRDVLSVVADQLGSPTSTHDLAAALVDLADHASSKTIDWGVYHFAGPETMSWAELARRIFSLANYQVEVREITGEAYGAPAPRPAFSALDSSKIKRATGLTHRPLDIALRELLERAS